jgi:hypothetical protein
VFEFDYQTDDPKPKRIKEKVIMELKSADIRK